MEMLNSILRITMIVLLFRAIFTIATSFALSKKNEAGAAKYDCGKPAAHGAAKKAAGRTSGALGT
jgi:NADH:ubiquinone oxidoreductase subunit 3 (subunit A)